MPACNDSNTCKRFLTSVSVGSGDDMDKAVSDFWSPTKSMTVRKAWKLSMEQLQKNGISEPEWSVPHLLASALHMPWSNGFCQLQQAIRNENSSSSNKLADRILTPSELALYQSFIQRRLEHEPLQYILGKWDFLDYEELVVQTPLLCPRPETEELVELVRQDIQKQQKLNNEIHGHSSCNILEIGCGTGVIGIALADKVKDSKVTAIDIEPAAIEISLENAKRVLGPDFGQRYSAVECSAQDFSLKDGTCFDVVVSNPPYIPQADMEYLSRDVIEYESDQALCGGEDGMDVIRTIIEKWALEWGTKSPSMCWLEVDPTHPSLLDSWLDGEQEQKDVLGVKLEETHKDLSGRERFVKLTFR